MRRWMSVDMAHYQDVALPPIKVFEIGGVYFVRDGNHRVSVAKAKGAEFIDAEVISLSSEIPLTPDMGFGRAEAGGHRFREGALPRERPSWTVCVPGARIEFTEVGRYDELLAHIREHKWYINLKKTDGDPVRGGGGLLVRQGLLPHRPDHPRNEAAGAVPADARRPTCTCSSDRHWSELGKRYGPAVHAGRGGGGLQHRLAEDSVLQAAMRSARAGIPGRDCSGGRGDAADQAPRV